MAQRDWKDSSMPRPGVCLLLVLLLTVSGSEIGSQTRSATSQPIRQMDHIMIRTGNPQELYDFFTETLKLPVAWPMTSPRAGVVTGGVGFGNVNVEAIQVPGQTDSRPRLVGFAFEPSELEESLSELNRRGITSGERRPLIAVGPDGSKNTLWTNVTLRQFSDADGPANATLHIFLSEYSPSYVNVEQRRARLRKQLVERSGGPLGVVDVMEVIIGVTDLEMARRLWQRLLDPARSAMSSTWQIGNGPAIRLVSATENRIQTMVIRVASLDRAKAFLRDKQLLGAHSHGQMGIDPSKLGGLDVRLVGK
jgi:catechol 2,3-dioxygenase-like lactoylglutathione lyase family enzyme